MAIVRYKVSVEYDGTNYCGYQKQPDMPNKSVEEILENAVFELSQERVKITASGRTDAGVHAIGQVVHFDLSKHFEPLRIVKGLNNYLRTQNIAVLDCEIMDENFHARFSTTMRHYRYLIVNRPAPLILQKNRAMYVSATLDVEAMRAASKFLIGIHDFSSFRDSQCQALSVMKNVQKIEITKNADQILIEISATSFLHHMVRNIVGTLVWVGSGKISVEEVKNILEAKDRTKSGPNAPAFGLYFFGVDY